MGIGIVRQQQLAVARRHAEEEEKWLQSLSEEERRAVMEKAYATTQKVANAIPKRGLSFALGSAAFAAASLLLQRF